MNREELKIKLNELGIPSSWYSLYGDRIPDCTILECSYKWELFDLGERGEIKKIGSFDSEEEACSHFYELMVHESKITEAIKNREVIEPIKDNKKRLFLVSDSGETKLEIEDSAKDASEQK